MFSRVVGLGNILLSSKLSESSFRALNCVSTCLLLTLPASKQRTEDSIGTPYILSPKFVSGVLTVLLLNDVGCAEVRCKNLSKKDH